MRTLSSLLLLGLCAVVLVGASEDVPLWGAEYCPVPQHKKPTFAELRKLLEDEDTSGFNAGASKLTGDNGPSIGEMSAMFNTLKTGKIPEYITKHNYVHIGMAKDAVNYNYSNGNIGGGAYNGFQLLTSDGSSGTHINLAFLYIKGKFGDFEYSAGQALAYTTDFVKGDDTISYTGSVKGAFMWQMPEGHYVAYGTYIGCSEGALNLTCGALIGKTDSLGIMKTNQYFSKTVTENICRYEPEKYLVNSEMISITGGSNATVTYSGSYPRDSYQGSLIINGTVRNSEGESSMDSKSPYGLPIDRTDPFGDDNLLLYFSAAGYNIGVYRP